MTSARRGPPPLRAIHLTGRTSVSCPAPSTRSRKPVGDLRTRSNREDRDRRIRAPRGRMRHRRAVSATGMGKGRGRTTSTRRSRSCTPSMNRPTRTSPDRSSRTRSRNRCSRPAFRRAGRKGSWRWPSRGTALESPGTAADSLVCKSRASRCESQRRHRRRARMRRTSCNARTGLHHIRIRAGLLERAGVALGRSCLRAPRVTRACGSAVRAAV